MRKRKQLLWGERVMQNTIPIRTVKTSFIWPETDCVSAELTDVFQKIAKLSTKAKTTDPRSANKNALV